MVACWHVLPVLLPMRGIRDCKSEPVNVACEQALGVWGGGVGGGEKELLLSSSPPPSRQESLLVGYRECNIFTLLNSTTILNWTVIMTSTPLVYTQTVHLRTALTCHVLSAYVLAPGFKPFTVRLFSWLRCLR